MASQGWGYSFPPWLPSLCAEAFLVLSCFLPCLQTSPVVLLCGELFILQGAGLGNGDKQEEVAGQFPAAGGGGLAGLSAVYSELGML